MLKAHGVIFKTIRILIKILLCMSAAITLEALLMFLNQFVVTSEGIRGWSTITSLLFLGDGPYNFQELFWYFENCSCYSLGFLIINIIFDIIAIIKDKKSNVNA